MRRECDALRLEIGPLRTRTLSRTRTLGPLRTLTLPLTLALALTLALTLALARTLTQTLGPLRERCTQQQDASRELVGIRDELVAQLHAQRAARRTELTLTLAQALALACGRGAVAVRWCAPRRA